MNNDLPAKEEEKQEKKNTTGDRRHDNHCRTEFKLPCNFMLSSAASWGKMGSECCWGGGAQTMIVASFEAGDRV